LVKHYIFINKYKKIENLIIYIYDKIINHTKHTMNNPDALASALDTDVNVTIIALNCKELINKVTKNKLETLLNEERNNVTTTLKSLDSIQQMLKLMEKREMNDGWWINIVKLLRHNERTRTITARVKLASIKAIINKIRNMYNLVWTQPPSLLSTPLLDVPPSPLQTLLQTPSLPSLRRSLSPLRRPLLSLLKDNIKKWKLTLDEVKKYIDENNKRPSVRDETNEIKKQGKWITQQQQNYRQKIQNMKYKIYRKLWKNFIKDDKYKEYFLSNEEVWKKNLEFVKKYIDENKKRPSITDKNKEYKKYSMWLYTQQKNYKNQKQTMSNNTIRKLWENFINEYEDYL